MVALLVAKELSYRYPNGVLALDGASIELRQGELVAVIGPNGAGKSSLCRCLAGLLEPQAGDVQVLGRKLFQLAIRHRAKQLCLVLQGLEAPAGLRVLEVVMMGRHPHLAILEAPGRHDMEIVVRSLRAMRAHEFRERLFGELSAGERQRVLLARALAQETAVILLDEPTSALDPAQKLAILARLRALLHDPESLAKRTLLFVTHDLNLASQFADRIVLLHEGRVHAVGSPLEVLQPKILEAVYGGVFVHGSLLSQAVNEERPWVLPWLMPEANIE